jgi:hypothetical protein
MQITNSLFLLVLGFLKIHVFAHGGSLLRKSLKEKFYQKLVLNNR